MGWMRRKKLEWLSSEESSPLYAKEEELRKEFEDLVGKEIFVLTKRPDENCICDMGIELTGFKHRTKPDERVVLGREKYAELWNYEECPNCGIYGAGDVETCLCGYKFKNY